MKTSRVRITRVEHTCGAFLTSYLLRFNNATVFVYSFGECRARDRAGDPPTPPPKIDPSLLGACLLVGRLSTCWVLVHLLGACLPLKCSSTCWVLGYVLGGCLPVGCLTTCWAVVCLLGACLLLGCLFTSWALVYFWGACLLTGCLFTCWVLVYLVGESMSCALS